MIRFALAGNPNSGKTTLFNSLTGSTAHVGNWPGVTVEKREGVYKNKKSKESILIIDLPGIYSLSPYSPEEIVSREFLVNDKPDCIINIIDASNFERNLFLTTQLLELDVPLVIALNMMDILNKTGEKIDVKNMERQLGVPVVEISALKENHLDDLMNLSKSAASSPRLGQSFFKKSARLDSLIKDVKARLDARGVSNSLFRAVKISQLDELYCKEEQNQELVELVLNSALVTKESGKEAALFELEDLYAAGRYDFIADELVINKSKPLDSTKPNLTDKIDKVMTSKWFSIPIFFFIMFLIFHFTFSENLFFLGGLFSDLAPSFEGTKYEGLFWSTSGINSPGMMLFNLFESTMGLISGSVESLFRESSWVSSLIVDGILGGLFAVLSFLPQIMLLFLFFSILEDTGYMARAAFILDRIFRHFGLSGRAFMPMIMGFGCSVPAIMNTRTLTDQNERTATIRVIPFFSCGAKLPILTAVAGAISISLGLHYTDLITYSMYSLGIIVAIISVIVMRKTTNKGDITPFVMELPAYHLPKAKSLFFHLVDKIEHFIKKAFTIILAATIVIWFFTNFTWSFRYISDGDIKDSMLANIGKFIQPIFTPLGFGAQLGEYGWVFAVAAITGLVAKEQVISTMGTLAGIIISASVDLELDGGVGAVTILLQQTGISIPGLLAFIAFNMTTIPCFATVATARAELPKKKFLTTILFWIFVSFAVGTSIYLIGSWWWTALIISGILILVLFVIYNLPSRRVVS